MNTIEWGACMVHGAFLWPAQQIAGKSYFLLVDLSSHTPTQKKILMVTS